MTKDALRLALEALEDIHPGNMTPMAEEYWNKAITAIKEALAQPEQEPVAYVKTVIEALYENSDPVSVEAAELLERITTPPQRKPLSDEEAQQIFAKHNCTISTHLAGILTRAIEAKLKEKNT